MVGASSSRTTTVNPQAASFPAASMAVHATTLVPIGNAQPLGGSQTTSTPGQLSVALGSKVTTALHRPASALRTTLLAHNRSGLSRSSTSTLNPQLTVLLLTSVAVQPTSVVPRGKRVPEGGTHTTVAPAQSSATLGAKFTTASQRPRSVPATMLLGHTSIGGSMSCTVTVKEQLCVFVVASVAVHVTVVIPIEKREPLAGTQTTITPGQLSVAVALNVATASHCPAVVNNSKACGQVITGRSRSTTVTVKAH